MSLLTRTVLCFILSIIYKFSNTFVCDIWYWGFCIHFTLCNPQYTIMSCAEHLTLLLFKFQSWKSMFVYCFLLPPTHNNCQCSFIRSACQKVWFNVHITDASTVKHLCQLCNTCQHFFCVITLGGGSSCVFYVFTILSSDGLGIWRLGKWFP
jgi:hypothetical protein